MKTLKKTLCLVLAVVMAVGVLVIPASAVDYDDYTDVAEIDHPIAVEVLTALGILNGNDDGSFAPDEILTRAQGAKILVETILGDTAQYLDNSASTFVDVKAGNWAAGYIAYAASAGIINGVGKDEDGNDMFAPDAQLTGYQFAKLLLVAMGVDGDYVGTNWRIDVGLNAAKYHLLTDLTGIALNDPISRQDAVQMAFNGLMETVTGVVEQEYQVSDSTGKVLTTTKNEIVALSYALNNEGAIIEVIDTNTGSLGDTVYGLRKVTHTDDFGRKNVRYTAKNGDVNVDVAKAEPKTYNAPVTTTKIGSDMGVASVSTGYTLNIKVNGVDSPLSGVYHRNDAQAAVATLGGYGATVEVYDVTTDANKPVYDVIVVYTYAKKLASKDIVGAKAATATTDAVKAHIVLAWDAAGETEVLTYNTAEFKKDNVVLYTVANGKVQSVELATPVTGKITRYNRGSNVTVNGTVYNNSVYDVANDVVPDDNIFNTDYVFYTDSRNNVYGRDSIAAAAVTNIDGYVYVKNYQVLKTGNSGDLFKEDVATSYAVKATVMDVNGASSVVDVAVTSKTTAGVTTFSFGKPGTDGVVTSTDLSTETNAVAAPATIGGWAGYTVNDAGEYVFQSLPAVAAYTTVQKTNKSSSVVTVGGLDRVMISSSTYNVINTKSVTKSTKTGYSNIQITDPVAALVIFTDSTNAIVKDVYVVTNVVEVQATPFDYAYVADIGAQVEGGTEVTFYVGGEIVTYVVDNNVISNFAKKSVYGISVVDGKITTAPVLRTADKSGVVSFIDPGFILVDTKEEPTETVADDVTIVLESSTVVYNVTSDGAGAVDDIEVEDTVMSVLGSDGKTAVVFIIG